MILLLRQLKPCAIYILIATVLILSASACGNDPNSLSVETPDQRQDSESPPPLLSTLEELVYSDSYRGYLVVHLKEGIAPRLSANRELYSESDDDAALASINSIVSAHQGAILSRATPLTEEETDSRRLKLERLSGQTLTDWNLIYHISTDNPREALELMRSLQSEPGVQDVYPALRPSPADLHATPSLTPHQTYLLAESTNGGLNAVEAWTRGIKGAEITIADNENGINLGHEDLGLTDAPWWEGGSYPYIPDCAPGHTYRLSNCPSWIAHGTAVAGVLAGKDNEHGITGFAPESRYLSVTPLDSTYGALHIMTDGVDTPASVGDDDLEPGSVWVIEFAMNGRCSIDPSLCGHAPLPSDCATNPDREVCKYGQVPTELWPEDFSAIQDATAYGVTVVSAAGNGQMDLNNHVLYEGDWSFAHNLATDDAGSIMVGASEGSNERKISFSNCGSRLNAFAWGQGVVTTGYPYGSYGWTGTPPAGLVNDPSDPNNYYTNNFGGTSSAAAMVGGAVALLQSHARSVLGHRRYITPAKVRDLIFSTGVPQRDASGCNIGNQPRMDALLDAAGAFIASAQTSYPELGSTTILTDSRYLSLRTLGVGIVCKEHDLDRSDPVCPDSQVFPVGERFAKDLDFDGDGRADLVQWTNGTWKIDLSNTGSGGDNFGAWDIEITHPALDGRWVVPYVIDMNKDGRSDFVVYDREHGTWYVALTDFELIKNARWHGWDWTLDYSTVWTDLATFDPFGEDPAIPNSRISRAVPGDYNSDGWTDIAIACSDGYWRIDYGIAADLGRPDGTFDRSVKVIPDDELAAAPGWAYQMFTGRMRGEEDSLSYFGYKAPDGTTYAGKMAILTPTRLTNLLSSSSRIFGGNDSISVAGEFFNDGGASVPGIKNSSGLWKVTSYYTSYNFYTLPLENVYGSIECHPVVANFDGDEFADRAVMCPEGWRIVYSSSDRFALDRDGDGVRRVPLTYNETEFTLPGRSYAGGSSYADVRASIEMKLVLDPTTPPDIPIDMMRALDSSGFGELDTAFGTAGVITWGPHSSIGDDTDVAIDSNGRIIVANSVNNGTDWDIEIRCYNPNGTPDSSFGSGGLISEDGIGGTANGLDYVSAIEIDSSDRIVAVASTSNGPSSDIAVLRYLNNGRADTSFGVRGKTIIDAPAGFSSDDFAHAVKIAPDGKIVIAGTGVGADRHGVGTDDNAVIIRLNEDGTLDTTFNGNGIAAFDPDTDFDSETFESIGFDSSGNIVALASSAVDYPPSYLRRDYNSYVLRYTALGALDTSFGTGGIVTLPGSRSDRILVDPSGRIIVAKKDGNILRLTSSGDLDSTFGSSGIVSSSVSGSDLAFDAANGILVIGDSENTMARINSRGTVNFRFNHRANPAIGTLANLVPMALALDSENRKVVVGRYTTGGYPSYEYRSVIWRNF